MKKCIHLLMISTVIFAGLTSCEKSEGEGGTSTIKGTIMVRDYNADFTTLYDIYPAAEEDVYIIYGDDDFYSDEIETHYDGTFQFKYLREGKYTVYAYSEDSAHYWLGAHHIPVIREVEITSKHQEVIVDTFYILK